MNTIEAFNRNTKTKGQLNTLRKKGEVPGIVYGGKDANQKISLLKKTITAKNEPICKLTSISNF